MFKDEEIEMIRHSIKKGNNIMIRQKGREIQIMEEKAKIVCSFDKDRKLPEKSDKP